MVEGQRSGKFSQNGKFGQNGKLGHSCVRVTKGRSEICYCAFRTKVEMYAAPPIIVGVWPITLTLWQQFEYYYYYFNSKITHYAVFPMMHGKRLLLM